MNMNRRDILKTAAGAAAAAMGMTGQLQAKSTMSRPNIVYIIADDLGYGDLSCYGQKKFCTPNIDRLAAEGLKFTDHYSGSTVCAPSRCCLMSGLHTGHAYIRGNREQKPIGQEPIPDKTVTVAELLKKAGYATGCFGKWGLGPPESSGDPVKQGFDEFLGYNCQRNAHNYYPPFLWHNDKKVPMPGNKGGKHTTYSHNLIVNRAMEFIRRHSREPFFCYMPVTIPHASMHVPDKYHDRFRKKFPQFEDKVGKYAGPDVRNPVAAFAAMVAKLDEDVGRITDLLKELGLDDNTLVIFTSDNGPHLEGGHDPRFFDSNGPLRGFKRDLYEGGIRVPMIARWPAKIKPAGVTHHVSAFWDVLPTFCEIAGVEPPKGIDGISFLPTLAGRKQPQHEYLYWEFHARGGKQAVRMGMWKAVRLRRKRKPDGPIELYDLEKDLGEKNNIADEHPDIVEKIDEIMTSARTESKIWKFPQK